MFKNKHVVFGLMMVIIFSSMGCAYNKNTSKNDNKVKISLPQTLVLDYTDSMRLLTIADDKMVKIPLELKEQVLSFNEDTLITKKEDKDGVNIIFRKGDNEGNYLLKGNLEYIKINKDCSKAIYKLQQNEEYVYGILNLISGKTTILKNEISISGNIIDFIDNSNIVFYGADIEKKITGLYKYNVDSCEYSLLNIVNQGFVEFLKPISDSEIFYLVSNFEESRSSFVFNVNDDNNKLVTSDILSVTDVSSVKDRLFFLGKSKSNIFSLYTIKDSKVVRLVYDFPKNINKDTMIMENEGKIYFVGYDDEENKSNLFAYSISDKSTNMISSRDGKYEIVKKADKY